VDRLDGEGLGSGWLFVVVGVETFLLPTRCLGGLAIKADDDALGNEDGLLEGGWRGGSSSGNSK
jgi:hypothetical protein